MQGGFGIDSYAKNSELQNYYFHAHAKSFLGEAAHLCTLFDQPCPRTFRIADFGCSSGRNTLEHAQFVVELLRRKRGTVPTEIQYFFSDVPTNDFNSLFQLMTPLNKDATNQELLQLYAAGVPGSFYTRLFPESSLHFATSILSLHWLSRVPPAVLEKTSPAWNGGHIWIHGLRPKVAEAYARQFQSDIKMFLKCRAAELAKGAILFFISPTRTEEHPKGAYYDRFEDKWSGSFECAWEEMVSEGVVDAEERDMFNITQYNFHRAEFELALRDVPELEVVKIEVVEDNPSLSCEEMKPLWSNSGRFADFWVGTLMAAMKPTMQKHIGEERTAEFSKRMHRIVEEKASSIKNRQLDFLIAVLRRQ